MDALSKLEYQEKGYLIAKNVVPLEHIHDLYQIVAHVLYKHRPDLPNFTQDEPWANLLFHQAMFIFRTENPIEFGFLFDTVQASTSLWRLGTERKLCQIAAELMEDDNLALSITDMLLRMDAPQDTRNRLEWHQDSSYFRQNNISKNGCVCSIPMIDLLIEHGPLEILPGSQALGCIDIPSSGKTNTIPHHIIESFHPHQVMINAGDAIFFNFDLIHRSGFNSSQFFRFTAIARYHQMLASDFHPGRLVYRARPMTSVLQLESG